MNIAIQRVSEPSLPTTKHWAMTVLLPDVEQEQENQRNKDHGGYEESRQRRPSRDRKRRDVITSYGSCDHDNTHHPQVSEGGGSLMVDSGRLRELEETLGQSLSCSEDDDDGNDNDDDEDDDHVASNHLITSHSWSRRPLPSSTLHESFVTRTRTLPAPSSSLSSLSAQRRRVSFQGVTAPAAATAETSNSNLRPSQREEFRLAWKRKSSRRISALLGNTSRSSTSTRTSQQYPPLLDQRRIQAQHHWAILRSHVLSGQFLLSWDDISSGSNHGHNPNHSTSHRRRSSVESTTTTQQHQQHQHRKSTLARNLKAEIRGGIEWNSQQCFLAIAVYLILAVICFNYVIPETRQEWTIVDSIYFAMVTATTIGFGDLVPPNTQLARIFTCLYALAGVACWGVALGVLGNYWLELESKAMQYYEQDVLALFDTTTNNTNNSTCTEQQQQQQQEQEHAEMEQDVQDLERQAQYLLLASQPQPLLVHPAETTWWKRIWNRMTGTWCCWCWWCSPPYQALTKVSQPSHYHQPNTATSWTSSSIPGGGSGTTPACQQQRRKEMYHKRYLWHRYHRMYRYHQSRWVPRWLQQHVNWRIVIYIALLFGLSYWIGQDAGWDFSQTMYFAITTSCTIGYGDKVPTSQSGRLAVIVFIPFAIGAMGYILHQVADFIVRSRTQSGGMLLFQTSSAAASSPSMFNHMAGTTRGRNSHRQRQRELTVMDLAAMDTDGDGNVDWSEFLEFMLVAMRKVDEDLLWQLRFQFDSLDVDDTGVLSKQNLICMARRKLHHCSHKLRLAHYKQYLLNKASHPAPATGPEIAVPEHGTKT